MKVTNWWKRLATSLVVAGALSPSLSHAASIALADPGFEAYAVVLSGTSTAHEIFATVDYNTSAFSNAATGYRVPDGSHTQSAWVDDPGYKGLNGYYQDSDEAYHGSNFLYRSGSTGAGTRQRPMPHGSSLQAMHGYYHYNGQTASGVVFEAGKTYKFSMYAQGSAANTGSYGAYVTTYGGWSSAVDLYIYDGTNPGYDGVTTGLNDTALAKGFYEPACATASNAACTIDHPIGDFLNRGASVVGTNTTWTQISLYHYVAPGSPEVGHAIGVGFYGFYASNVDDASLEVFNGNVPEPTSVVLVGITGLAVVGGWRRRLHEKRGPD